VTRVADGQAALETFRASQEGAFQAILMDMQMPVMDGCTAAAEIRKLDRADAGTVAIFACTANTFMEDRERAEASGMTDFLTKPVDVSELMKKLSSCAAVPMPPERGATT
jgi:CheY-like chemotaxis protein